MRIIDNKKDYYDYLVGIYGIDDYITYDRRDSVRLSNDNNDSVVLDNNYSKFPIIFCPWKNGICPSIWRKHDPSIIKYNSRWDDTVRKSKMFPEAYSVNEYMIGILIGFKLYIFTVYRILENENDELVKIVPQLEYVKDYDRSGDIIKDVSAPILIGELSFDSTFAFIWKYRQQERDENFFKTAELIIDPKIQSVKNRTFCNHIRYVINLAVINPIMSNTWIPKMIPAQDVWNNISDYLLAIKDKPIIDNRTDIEHAESHGFDKKTSFRNM